MLAAPLLLSSVFLPKALAAFRARHPSITVLLNDSLPQQVLPNVRNRSADLGLGTFAVTEPDLDRVVLFKDLLVAVAPNDHPAARKRRLAWADLAGTPLIFLTRDGVPGRSPRPDCRPPGYTSSRQSRSATWVLPSAWPRRDSGSPSCRDTHARWSIRLRQRGSRLPARRSIAMFRLSAWPKGRQHPPPRR